MRRSPPPGRIRPKISSMPRQKSEDTVCLDVYKLVVERKRLKLELEKLEQRRQIISDRIQQLDSEIGHLENEIQVMREAEAGKSKSEGQTVSPKTEPITKELEGFETLTLDY